MTQPNNDPAMEAAKEIDSAEMPAMSQFLTHGQCRDARHAKIATIIRTHYPLPPRDAIEQAVGALERARTHILDHGNDKLMAPVIERADSALTSLRTLLAGETKTVMGEGSELSALREVERIHRVTVEHTKANGYRTDISDVALAKLDAIRTAMRNEQGGGS